MVIETCVEGLRYRARAFRTIGMNLVADDLDRDLAASQETSAGLMKLALSGALKDSG
jgi:hypothetical protein